MTEFRNQTDHHGSLPVAVRLKEFLDFFGEEIGVAQTEIVAYGGGDPEQDAALMVLGFLQQAVALSCLALDCPISITPRPFLTPARKVDFSLTPEERAEVIGAALKMTGE